ncbi:fimbrial protein [Edwardsiella piscicida]|nr:fimbrial protein [Edwardsiella piscicida]
MALYYIVRVVMKKIIIKRRVVGMALSSLLFVSSAHALDINIRVSGEIYIPPCVINDNNSQINIDFGSVLLPNIDGVNYAKSKTVNVNCEYYQGRPYISVMGAQLPGTGGNVLQTTGPNAASLGIALYQGNGVNSSFPLKIGAGEQGKYGFPITNGLRGINTGSGQFTFTAVPYKSNGTNLVAARFSATATMSIIYL